jgi:hypothetical protein
VAARLLVVPYVVAREADGMGAGCFALNRQSPPRSPPRAVTLFAYDPSYDADLRVRDAALAVLGACRV